MSLRLIALVLAASIGATTALVPIRAHADFSGLGGSSSVLFWRVVKKFCTPALVDMGDYLLAGYKCPWMNPQGRPIGNDDELD